MTITVFTSNQPRHIALIESLASIATMVHAIQECNTVFPGQVEDFFRKSPVMQDYFSRVISAEGQVFGKPRFLPANSRSLAIKMGDVSRLPLESFGEALLSDVFVVFGASYIKGPLCDWLVERGALNIHMGVSPYYRGSSTNFWAMYDNRPDLVGATIHLLSRGLDSGPMLFHALPKVDAVDPFVHGMRAVQAAHAGLVEYLALLKSSPDCHAEVLRSIWPHCATAPDPSRSTAQDDRLPSISTEHKYPRSSDRKFEPVMQDKSRELRYTRNSDFTDAVAAEYLNRVISPEQLADELRNRDTSLFLRPFIPR